MLNSFKKSDKDEETEIKRANNLAEAINITNYHEEIKKTQSIYLSTLRQDWSEKININMKLYLKILSYYVKHNGNCYLDQIETKNARV